MNRCLEIRFVAALLVVLCPWFSNSAQACKLGKVGEVVRPSALRAQVLAPRSSDENGLLNVVEANACPKPDCDTPTCETFQEDSPFVRLAGYAQVPVDTLHYTCFAVSKLSDRYYVALASEDGTFHRSLSRDGLIWNPQGAVSGLDRPGYKGFRCPDPHFVGDEGEMELFYSSNDSLSGWGISYATSDDYGASWTAYGTVFQLDEPGYYAYMPSVVRYQGEYRMVYAKVCKGSATALADLYLARSTDGIHWTPLSDEPALSTSECGAWDDGSVNRPRMVVDPDGSTLHIFYSGFGWVGGTVSTRCSKIGHAASHDGGRSWCRTELPVLDRPAAGETWDDNFYAVPSFTWERDQTALRIYYLGVGLDREAFSGIGAAEAEWPLPDPCD